MEMSGSGWQVVFRRGGHLTQEAQEDPAAVPRILERWVDAQDSSSEAEQLRDALEHLLLQRPGNGSGTSLVTFPTIHFLVG